MQADNADAAALAVHSTEHAAQARVPKEWVCTQSLILTSSTPSSAGDDFLLIKVRYELAPALPSDLADRMLTPYCPLSGPLIGRPAPCPADRPAAAGRSAECGPRRTGLLSSLPCAIPRTEILVYVHVGT